MSSFRSCDWCGADLYSRDYAELIVTVKRRRTGILDAKWAQEARPTLHFCVGAELDREGRNRMGLPDEEDAGDGCFERAVRAVRGTRTATPDMGLKWRLPPVGVKVEDRRPSAAPPAPVAPDADLASFLAPLAPQPRAALKRALRAAGVATLDQLDAMTDDELMDMPGVGWTTRTKIRDFLARRTAAQETEKANGEGVA